MDPKYLGVAVPRDRRLAATDLDLIEWTPPPCAFDVALDVSHFASRCPVTGQPDFATLSIRYEPFASLVETKSLKLWLQSFQEVGAFNEALVVSIARDFFAVVQPRWVTVDAHFTPRGGISVSPHIHLSAEDQGL